MEERHDVVVLGSGIAGSVLALVLARSGLDTLVVERKRHPRFVIGESTDPTTSLLFRHLATTYDLPELAQLGHYLGLREIGCPAWPKQLFWYGVHEEGADLTPGREAMLEGFPLPNGPEVHLMRANADAWLASRLARYGVPPEEETEVLDFEAGAGGPALMLRGAAGTRAVRARLVVDATGHASFLARRFGLRDAVPRLRTNTRSIFGHVTNVPALDEVLGGPPDAFRFRRSGGTMHHVFRDGWCWVIPFDNGVTSVGFQLDRDTYPLDERVSAGEEVRALLARFPTLRAHLGAMEPLRPFVRTDRVQFTARDVVGEGFVLAPHAAAFVEPLFSPGIVLTLAFVERFAAAARTALAADDFSPDRFRHLGPVFEAETRQVDLLVSGALRSFRDYDLFRQYWRCWIVGSLAQAGTCILAGGVPRARPMLYGSGLPGFPEALGAMHAVVNDAARAPREAAAEVARRVAGWFERICLPALSLRGTLAAGEPGPCALLGSTEPAPVADWLRRLERELAPHEPAVRAEHAERWLTATAARRREQGARYRRSRDEGGEYHRAYDRILANANASFDYRAHAGLEAG